MADSASFPPSPGSNPTSWTVKDANEALRRLLNATLTKEKEIAKRDTEVAQVEQRHSAGIEKATADIEALEAHLEEFYRAQRDLVRAAGRDSMQLAHGVMGIRIGSQGSLVPVNEKWNWEKITRKLRRVFKARFFRTPQPPALDKLKVKKELTAEQLAECGLKIERAETFYIDLNRLPPAA